MSKSTEIKRVRYYYYRSDSLVNNTFTACLLLGKDNEVLSRGVAICSLLECFNKKEGRKKSYSRAMSAYWNEENSEIINEDYLLDKYVTRKFKSKIGEIIKEKPPIVLLMNIIEEGSKTISVYKISRNYSIYETKKFFNFKSEFKPKLTDNEKRILGIKND